MSTSFQADEPESKLEERGLERLIFFSDAVVAIAITLLVLPLTELKPEQGEGAWDFLRSESDELLAFAISFLVIARFWFAHHALFKNLVRMDRWLLWLNTGWLASIVFLPFPTALLNDRGGFATLYLLNLLCCSGLTTALDYYIDRHPNLLERPETAADSRNNVFGVVLLGSIILALIASLFWQTSAMLLLLLAPLGQHVVERFMRPSAPA